MEKQPLLASTPSTVENGGPTVLSALKRSAPWGGRSAANVWRLDLAPWLPARFVLCFMSCLGFANVFLLRVNLSVALVQMDRDTATVTNHSARVFDWSSSEQGWVLSSFFIGYLFLQVPAGLLSQRFGGKWFMGVGILATSVLTLLTPVAANLSVWALVAVRVLEGLFEGITYPAMHALWGKWAPPNERSALVSISYLGANVGVIIGFPLSGLLCEYGFDGGWPSVFYLFGVLGIIWFLFWSFLVFDSPAVHPRISEREKRYIEGSIGDKEDAKVPVPWWELLTSMPFWAVTTASFTLSWGSFTIITCLPTYFNQALGLRLGADSIVMNGVYSAIPFVVSFFVVIVSGPVSDLAISHGVSTTIVRKAGIFTGNVGSAFFLLICGYFGNSLMSGVSFVSVAVGVLALTQVATYPNLIDIAPRFTGLTMALSNTLATAAGIIAPQVAKAIATEPPFVRWSEKYISTYKDEWRDVLILGAMILIFGALVHAIMGSGQRQSWADGSAWYRSKVDQEARDAERNGTADSMILNGKVNHGELGS